MSNTAGILNCINRQRGSFNIPGLAELLAGEKGGQKKKINPKSLAKIEGVLASLVLIGFLVKENKKYTKNKQFPAGGTIKIKGSGAGLVRFDDGFEVLVEKENTAGARDGDPVTIELTDIKSGIFWGKVVKLQGRKKTRHLARIEEISTRGTVMTLLDTPGSIKVWTASPPPSVKKGYYAFVEVSEETSRMGHRCEIRESFPPDTEDYDVQRIVVKHGLPSEHGDYKELKDIKSIIKKESARRTDFRHLFTVTIDGDHSKDFDDAVSLDVSGGMYRLYVHIADVSTFVRPGSPLDLEAQKRGTSFYIGNRVIPMLPEILSNELCSLNAGKDRLTLTAELIIDRNGDLRNTAFYRGIINVDKRLTYGQADELISGKGRSSLNKAIIQMNDLAVLLKKMRMTRGRVDLNIPNEEIIYDEGRTADIRFESRMASHRLIEEFMLSANEAASKTLREASIPALYRVHENISEEKIGALIGFFKTLGIRFDRGISIGCALQEIVDSVAGKNYEQVVNFIILRSFMQAYYGTEPVGHFGLGFKDYTHFTSPIRRYPDLVVHRCIKSLIEKKHPPYTKRELVTLGELNSASERVAVKAERDLVRLKACRILQGKKGTIFDVVVTSVSKYGINVALVDKPIEGMVPMRFLTDDYYMVNEDEYTVIGRRLGRRFRIGDRLKAELITADIDMMRIDFNIV